MFVRTGVTNKLRIGGTREKSLPWVGERKEVDDVRPNWCKGPVSGKDQRLDPCTFLAGLQTGTAGKTEEENWIRRRGGRS